MHLVNDYKEANCITHSGTMHADEVFSTAFLDLYLDKVSLYRTINVPEDIEEKTIVYDIGRGEYDHHQENAKKRENGITYCSFGLLWQKFGKDFLSKRKITNIDAVFSMFDKEIVEAIDAIDNGIFPKIEAEYKVKTLSDTIRLFNPSYKSDQDENIQFEKAVSFAKTIIEEALLNVIGKVAAKEEVLKALKNKENHTLYLEEYMPYEQTLLSEESGSDIYFVAYPSRGGYAIKTVPISSEDNNKRMNFPEEWAGLEKIELKEKSGIKGIVFCHSARFLVSCDTLDTVKEIVSKTIQINENSPQNTQTLD